MGAKLYITGIPFYLTETKLRPLLNDYHLHSLTVIETVDGDVGVVEVDSVKDAEMLTETLSRFTVFTNEGGWKLSVVQAASSEGQRLEQQFAHCIAKLKNANEASDGSRSCAG